MFFDFGVSTILDGLRTGGIVMERLYETAKQLLTMTDAEIRWQKIRQAADEFALNCGFEGTGDIIAVSIQAAEIARLRWKMVDAGKGDRSGE